jgi:hypothetical protein
LTASDEDADEDAGVMGVEAGGSGGG